MHGQQNIRIYVCLLVCYLNKLENARCNDKDSMNICSSPAISGPKGFSVCLWETDVYMRLIYADHVSSVWTVSVCMLNGTRGVSQFTVKHYPTCINIILWDSYLLAPKASRRWVVVCVGMRFRFGYHGHFELFPRPALASEGFHFNMSAACSELKPPPFFFLPNFVTNLY